MKKFIIILGGQAVGKMTVGRELSILSGYKIFHEHQVVELANSLYGYEISNKNIFNELTTSIKHCIFKSICKSKLDGIITTCLFYFDDNEHYKR